MINNKVKKEFLEKHLRFFSEYNSYIVLHFSILYWHLDDVVVFENVLSSEIIKESKGNVVKSNNGEKMYYELYTYLRLVKSESIISWLISQFPALEERYKDDFVFYGFACIDSKKKIVIEDSILVYKNLEEIINKY